MGIELQFGVFVDPKAPAHRHHVCLVFGQFPNGKYVVQRLVGGLNVKLEEVDPANITISPHSSWPELAAALWRHQYNPELWRYVCLKLLDSKEKKRMVSLIKEKETDGCEGVIVEQTLGDMLQSPDCADLWRRLAEDSRVCSLARLMAVRSLDVPSEKAAELLRLYGNPVAVTDDTKPSWLRRQLAAAIEARVKGKDEESVRQAFAGLSAAELKFMLVLLYPQPYPWTDKDVPTVLKELLLAKERGG